jgi:hypothetical protein
VWPCWPVSWCARLVRRHSALEREVLSGDSFRQTCARVYQTQGKATQSTQSRTARPVRIQHVHLERRCQRAKAAPEQPWVKQAAAEGLASARAATPEAERGLVLVSGASAFGAIPAFPSIPARGMRTAHPAGHSHTCAHTSSSSIKCLPVMPANPGSAARTTTPSTLPLRRPAPRPRPPPLTLPSPPFPPTPAPQHRHQLQHSDYVNAWHHLWSRCGVAKR